MSETQVSNELSKATANTPTASFISVIVPIRNEEDFIARTLDGLLGQDYSADNYEILVVDGESTDATVDVVKGYAEKHSHIHLLANPGRWSSRARNVGIEAARGEIIIVVDGHCQFEDDQYLRSIEFAFRRKDIDCLGRPQPLDVNGGNRLQQAIAVARSSRLGHHPDSFIYAEQEQTVPAHSVAVAYRKSVFDKVGTFDEDFDACEDVEFNHRIDKAGLACLLTPSIKLRYYPRASLVGLFRQMARYGRGRVRLLRKHTDTFSLKSLAPACLILFIVLGAIASIFAPLLAWPYFAVLGLYAGIIAVFTVTTSFSSSKIYFLWLLPAVVLAIHFGAGYGLLQELIFGKSECVQLDR